MSHGQPVEDESETADGTTDTPRADMGEQVQGAIYVTSDGRQVMSSDEAPSSEAEWDLALGSDASLEHGTKKIKVPRAARTVRQLARKNRGLGTRDREQPPP